MKLLTPDLLSDEAKHVLETLGARLKLARIRRREPMHTAAERIKTSVLTLRKLERGDPTISMSLYLAALTFYGFLNQLKTVADPDTDEFGKLLERQRQPKKVHAEKIDNDF